MDKEGAVLRLFAGGSSCAFRFFNSGLSGFWVNISRNDSESREHSFNSGMEVSRSEVGAIESSVLSRSEPAVQLDDLLLGKCCLLTKETFLIGSLRDSHPCCVRFEKLSSLEKKETEANSPE